MNRKIADRSFVMQMYDINSNAYINAYSRLNKRKTQKVGKKQFTDIY